MKYRNYLIRSVLILAVTLAAFSCKKDDTEDSGQKYGYLQFFVTKATTRATEIEYLKDAAKIRVNMIDSQGDVVSQALVINAFNNTVSEYGLQSEKCEIIAGKYKIIGFELFNEIDDLLMQVAYEESEKIDVEVKAGGLMLQKIFVNVAGRGNVKFQLFKDAAKDTKVNGVLNNPFHMIKWVDVRVTNLDLNTATNFNRLKVIYKNVEVDGHLTAVGDIDTLVSLPAGRYKISQLKTYFNSRYGTGTTEQNNNPVEEEFIVKDNALTIGRVPVTLDAASGYIKDAYALRDIWLALDGPNWSYQGLYYPKGTNWKFDNRDIDMWLAQPGVSVHPNGRLASISFEGFGAKGAMPAAIGLLTELRTLTIGSHASDPSFAQNTSALYRAKVVTENELENQKFEHRKAMEALLNPKDEKLKDIYYREMTHDEYGAPDYVRTIKSIKGYPAASKENYATEITSLPEEIGNLKKLERLYVAFGPMKDLPAGLKNCTSLTDVEIFNCPEMEVFPAVFAQMPKLAMLYFALNAQVSADEMYKGLKNLNDKAPSISGGSPIQGLYFPAQNLRALPDLTNLKRLAALNMADCGIQKIEKAFGKTHMFIELIAANNEISSLPVDEDGYFIGFPAEFEGMNFAYNRFTELPNIFSATAMSGGTVDFSGNLISKVTGTDDGTWRGINCTGLLLGMNKLTEFPAFFSKDETKSSKMAALVLTGNQISSFPEKAIDGVFTEYLQTILLDYNQLDKLPNNFSAVKFPYLWYMNLSFNRFKDFPVRPFNSASLARFRFRGQRDEDGNRCFKTWPGGIGNFAGLRELFLGSNDIRKVTDAMLTPMIFYLELNDNPNISIDLSPICPYIMARRMIVGVDQTQDFRGCDALKIKN